MRLCRAVVDSRSLPSGIQLVRPASARALLAVLKFPCVGRGSGVQAVKCGGGSGTFTDL